jgi:hypothetical protein
MKKERTIRLVKAYKADMDGFYSSIQVVEIDKSHIDNFTYFKTFNAAKKHVLVQLKDMINQYKNNYAAIKALKSIEA